MAADATTDPRSKVYPDTENGVRSMMDDLYGGYDTTDCSFWPTEIRGVWWVRNPDCGTATVRLAHHARSASCFATEPFNKATFEGKWLEQPEGHDG